MNRKLISAILALLLCLGLTGAAFASVGVDYVVDEADYLTDVEISALNAVAQEIYDTKNVGVFYVYTTLDSMENYNIATLTAGIEDYFIMMENDTSWTVFAGGAGENIDSGKVDELRAIYDQTPTYAEGVEDFLYAVAACFADAPVAPAENTQSAEEYLVFDEANLLTDSEEAALTQQLKDVSHTYNAQIIVATISSMNGGDIDSYLDYFYDSMGFGYGTNHDGALLLVCMDPREYRILSNGFAGVAISNDNIDAICNIIQPDLSDGDYANAFENFAEECAYYLDGHLNGFPFNFGKTLLISLIIGSVVGLIVVSILKGQLKSVRKQNQANNYTKPGSMNVTVRNDLFLYREVHKTRKETSSSSGSRGGGGSARSRGGGSF